MAAPWLSIKVENKSKFTWIFSPSKWPSCRDRWGTFFASYSKHIFQKKSKRFLVKIVAKPLEDFSSASKIQRQVFSLRQCKWTCGLATRPSFGVGSWWEPSGAEFQVSILRPKITRVHKMLWKEWTEFVFQLGEIIIWHFDPTFRFCSQVEYLGASLWIIQKVLIIHHESHVSYDESCDHRYGRMAWQLKCMVWSSNCNYKVLSFCPQDIQSWYQATLPRSISDTSIRDDLQKGHFRVGRRKCYAFLLLPCKFY